MKVVEYGKCADAVTLFLKIMYNIFQITSNVVNIYNNIDKTDNASYINFPARYFFHKYTYLYLYIHTYIIYVQ